MKNHYLLLMLFVITVSNSFSQSSYENYWNEVLSNNRETALELFKKQLPQDKKLSHHITEQILRAEYGQFKAPDNFVDELVSYQDYEYYLYALWNKEFIFNNYLKAGFNKNNITAAEKLSQKPIANQTINEALIYLNSVIARYNDDWEGYYKSQQQLTAIKDWQFCGVFENLNNSGLDIPYAPEKMAVSTKDFDANSHGFVNWYIPTQLKREAYQFFTNHNEYGYGVNYAQTFITNPKEQRVFLRFGNSGNFKVWLNDIVVYENSKDITSDLDAYNVEVTLPKGNNRLLIKNAESNSVSYFIARITDQEGHAVKDLTYSDSYSDYNQSSKEQIKPIKVEHSIEKFFKYKLKQNSNDFLNIYCLVQTYLRNSKYEQAKELLLPIQKKFPKSSMIRKLLVLTYELEEDHTSTQELIKNMELDDEDYYLALLYKFKDQSKLSRMDMESLEKFLNKLANATDSYVMKQSADIMLALRKSDKSKVKKNLDNLIVKAKKDQWVKMLNTYTSLYSMVLNDDDQEVKTLEYVVANYSDYGAKSKLVRLYNKQNKIDKAISLLESVYKPLQGDNYVMENIINQLHKYEKYEESLPYIEQALKNFPYSFVIQKLKGDALLQLKRKKEALQAYKKSLSHNSNNASLRKTIKDLNNEKEIIDTYVTKDAYTYISKNRGKNTISNYGFNILLDEAVNLLYPESGGKSKYTYIYEITAESGVERFKEYNLGLSGSYSILKSEIVKSNGSIVPAEKSGSSFVFNGLSIGDVIYVSYESKFGGFGRFYKDYMDTFQFDSYHPCTKTNYTLITPKGKEIQHSITNGDLNYTKESNNSYDIHSWTLENNKILSQQEYYMPNDVDVARTLHISTLSNWNDIAFWYSDLVRSQIQSNEEVNKVFNELFPEGIKNMSDEKKAKKIYYYIMDTMNYSYVSFRQSGYIPQKPSKTISSKLGDCKDFSTLFVTLAEKAGLDANLVLILTSDNGQQSLVLPSQNFNHCIAKVKLDGQDQFLELTDKYLPYKSLPTSLENATALEIPFMTTDNNQKFTVFKLKNVAKSSSVFTNNIKMKILGNKQHFDINCTIEGAISSYYKNLLVEPSYDVLKKSMYENFSSRLGSKIKVDTIYDMNLQIKNSNLKFSTQITSTEKINKIGNTKIIQLPKVSSAYSNDLIGEEQRKYPIEYIKYENVDHYITAYDILLEEGQKFTEIPKNASLSYKKHAYKINYTLVKDNHLKVSIDAVTDKTNITTEDYKDFQSFVTSVIEAKEAFIGYQ